MTLVSFRLDEEEDARLREWAASLGIDRSQLMREAVRRHLNALAAEHEATTIDAQLDQAEMALADVADWGAAEDWSDWLDAAR